MDRDRQAEIKKQTETSRERQTQRERASGYRDIRDGRRDGDRPVNHGDAAGAAST